MANYPTWLSPSLLELQETINNIQLLNKNQIEQIQKATSLVINPMLNQAAQAAKVIQVFNKMQIEEQKAISASINPLVNEAILISQNLNKIINSSISASIIQQINSIYTQPCFLELSRAITDIQKTISRTPIDLSTLSRINWEGLQSQIDLLDSEEILINPDGTIIKGNTSFNPSEAEIAINDVLTENNNSQGQPNTADTINELINKNNPIVTYILLPYILYLLITFSNPFLTPLADKFYSYTTKKNNQIVRNVRKEIKKEASDMQISIAQYKTVRIVSKNALPIRQNHTLESKIIGRCISGTKVIVLEKKRNWCKVIVIYQNNTTIIGWTHTRYLRPSVTKRIQ